MNKARMDEWMNWLRTETGTDKKVLRSLEQQRQKQDQNWFLIRKCNSRSDSILSTPIGVTLPVLQMHLYSDSHTDILLLSPFSGKISILVTPGAS